jgi:hypothetical protein
VDITPVASEARASNLQACGGCDTRLAKRVGAELAITGTVQKVSNLILNMNIYIREVSSGRTVAAMSADMRGNTDESWSRTLDWVVRNRLLAAWLWPTALSGSPPSFDEHRGRKGISPIPVALLGGRTGIPQAPPITCWSKG